MAIGKRIAEMVDDEEARVEAEEQAEREQTEQDEQSAVDAERAQRATYHLKRFFEFQGVEFPDDGVICPTCQMGFVAIQMQHDPHTERCAECAGVGRTLTYSLVPGNEQRVCVRCQGRGYNEVMHVEAAQQAPPGWQAPVVPYTPQPVAPGVS